MAGHLQGASSELQKNDQPAEQHSPGLRNNTVLSSEGAGLDRNGQPAAILHGSTAPCQIGSWKDNSSEPAMHAERGVDLESLERNMETILQRQLSRFEQSLASICDTALARFSEQLNSTLRQHKVHKQNVNRT